MRAIVLSLIGVLVLAPALLSADDHSVLFDEDIDFSTFRTFAVRDATLKAKEPSLTSPVLVKALAEAVREALIAKGLTESASQPDLVVECTVTGVDFDMNKWGVLRQMNNESTGRGGRRSPNPSPNHPDFSEATMVLDLKRADTSALVFRGVFHDTEKDQSALAARLPKDAATLLAKYPVKKK
jgi:hypothetical protein